MKLLSLYILMLLCASSYIHAMQQPYPYTFKCADNTDIAAITTLINEHAIYDNNKIVVVPEQFREKTVEDAIAKKRLFVAHHYDTVVAYKKLFIVDDNAELHNILTNEIRCVDVPPVDITSVPSTSNAETTAPALHNVTYLYNGGDFTHQAFRKKGINTKLTSFALNYLQQEICHHIAQNSSHSIAMLYGLTKDNAGITPCDGRSKYIVPLFTAFTQQFTKHPQTIIQRYAAFMPTFDAHAAVCIPLPDEKAVPGYGYVISRSLTTQELS